MGLTSLPHSQVCPLPFPAFLVSSCRCYCWVLPARYLLYLHWARQVISGLASSTWKASYSTPVKSQAVKRFWMGDEKTVFNTWDKQMHSKVPIRVSVPSPHPQTPPYCDLVRNFFFFYCIQANTTEVEYYSLHCPQMGHRQGVVVYGLYSMYRSCLLTSSFFFSAELLHGAN